VDDGLTSLTDKEQAIKLVKKTQKYLMDNGHIRLHKIVSNQSVPGGTTSVHEG
jgi:uncharacterized protein (DUF2164 family)